MTDPGGHSGHAPQKPERGPTYLLAPPKTLEENIINVVLLAWPMNILVWYEYTGQVKTDENHINT